MPISNIHKRREYQRRWMAKRRAEYFKDKKCIVCNSTTNLELDHIDPKIKVSHNIWSWSKARREAELVKCQVLCRICHKEKTTLSIRDKFKTYIKKDHGVCGTRTRYVDGCRCQLCRNSARDYMRMYRAISGKVAV